MPISMVTQYMVLIGVTLLFTVLSIGLDVETDKHIILQWLAAIGWFVSAYAHFFSGASTSVLTYSGATLFIGFGLIFAISAVLNSLQLLGVKHFK